VTPKFGPDLIPEGRLFEGEATLVPNLMPYDEHSAVCILTRAHVVMIDELLSSTLKSGFLLSANYLKAVRKASKGKDPLYGTLHMNFMPPSGGSLIHPHLQTFATRFPGNLHRLHLEKARLYAQKNPKAILEDLIDVEQKNAARYLGQLSKVYALVNFAPFGLLCDVLFIASGVRDWFDDGVSELGYLATLVGRTLKFLSDLNLFSFNLALFSGTPQDEGFMSFAILSPRLFIEPRFMAPDVSALRFLYDEPFSIVYPEDITERLKPYLKL
jgi:galactose-1-phosphate uridylyltransferase